MDAWVLVLYDKIWYLWRWKKGTKISSPENLTQWIIIQSIVYRRKAFEIINRSVRANLHLVLTGPDKFKYFKSSE